MAAKRIRFVKQDVRGTSGLLEWYQAKYGLFVFDVSRRPKTGRHYRRGIVASIWFGDPTYDLYRRVESIKAGKAWCRIALVCILEGLEIPCRARADGHADGC